MRKINIPIYRAKKIDSDEYVEGFYFNRKNMLGKTIYHKIDHSTTCDKFTEIDPSTLAIHFPDLIDSDGTKIFASLSEDGKGGNTYEIDSNSFKIIYKDMMIRVLYDDWDETLQLPEFTKFYIDNMKKVN